MKTIEITNYKKNDHGYYMDTYQPWHGGSNPNLDGFSDDTIVCVPPSDPAKHLTHGTKIFVDTFCIVIKQFFEFLDFGFVIPHKFVVRS